MKKQTFDKIFQKHHLVKILGITSLALILLIDIVGASPFAYVGYDVTANNNNVRYGAVSVIDIATKKVTATVPVELDIGGVTATPDGNKLYVTSPSTNVVSVIDAKTKKVTAKIDVGWRPHGVTVSPDGKKVYVANRDDNTISVIDTVTNGVIATVDVGSTPKAVTVNPAGTKLYVANTDDNTISVIDTETNSVIATVPVGHNPSGIAVTPDGTKVYVSNKDAGLYAGDMNTVSEIDAISNTVTQTFYLPGEAWGVSANPKGRWLYVPYSNIEFAGIAVYDTNKDSFYNVLWPDALASRIATTPDGKEIYVTMPKDKNVNVIDTMTGKTKAKIGIGNGNSVVFECITTGPGATPVPPTANFSSNVTSGYAPLSVQFNDTSTGVPNKWNWNFGDGQSSAVQNPVHIYSKAGNYTVSLNVTNKDGTNTKIINNYIKVKPPKPVANFSASPTSGKAPLKVQFTDKSTGSPTSWNWNFGDGTYSTQKNPAYTYSKAGNYAVSLTVKNSIGSNTKTIKNYIVATNSKSLVANFSALPTSGKAPLTVQFTDKSTGSPTSWNWNFGDGMYSTQKNPAYTYGKAGNYTVSITVKNAVGSNTKTVSGYIKVSKK